MEEDIFIKKMKGVKPFRKDAPTIKRSNINKKDLKLNKKTNTTNITKQKITQNKNISMK